MANVKNPCKDCRYRHINCHATCFLYKEWKLQTEVIRDMRGKDREINAGIHHKKTRKR